MTQNVSHSRWRFAQRHQREYQERKARATGGRTESLLRAIEANSTSVSDYLRRLGYPVDTGLVVEVGSGPSGLIWRWPAGSRLAIDPLAHFYRRTFREIQSDGPWIVQAQGERVPLCDGCAQVVLSDNVLDHVQDPFAYLQECRRILKPSGVLYMTVDVHHPVYYWAGKIYNFFFNLGIRANVPAFPSHPFHFTLDRIENLVIGARFKLAVSGKPAIPKLHSRPMANIVKDSEQYIKSVFFKNVRCVLVATI